MKKTIMTLIAIAMLVVGLNINVYAADAKAFDNKTATNEERALEIVRLINIERVKAGVGELKIDDRAMEMAQFRAEKMSEVKSVKHDIKGYGKATGEFQTQFGIEKNEISFGEIATANPNPDNAIASWLKSEGHKKLMLSDKFDTIGAGVVKDGYRVSNVVLGKTL